MPETQMTHEEQLGYRAAHELIYKIWLDSDDLLLDVHSLGLLRYLDSKGWPDGRTTAWQTAEDDMNGRGLDPNAL